MRITQATQSKSDLSGIQSVSINEARPGSPMKFILAKVEKDGEERFVIRALTTRGNLTTHNGILNALRENETKKIGASITTLGGAWMIVDEQRKRIWTWGYSYEQKWVQREDVVDKLLSENFKDYTRVNLNNRPETGVLKITTEIQNEGMTGVYPAALLQKLEEIEKRSEIPIRT